MLYFTYQIKVLISFYVQDFYSLLGVSRNASKSEIKSGIYNFYPFADCSMNFFAFMFLLE